MFTAVMRYKQVKKDDVAVFCPSQTVITHTCLSVRTWHQLPQYISTSWEQSQSVICNMVLAGMHEWARTLSWLRSVMLCQLAKRSIQQASTEPRGHLTPESIFLFPICCLKQVVFVVDADVVPEGGDSLAWCCDQSFTRTHLDRLRGCHLLCISNARWTILHGQNIIIRRYSQIRHHSRSNYT